MNEFFNSTFQRNIKVILPGEYTISKTTPLSTVLGTCVGVALFDPGTKMIGLNHFLLSQDGKSNQQYTHSSGRYGLFAMEVLINEMMKAGANTKKLRAKIFGGGQIMSQGQYENQIPINNIEFARKFLKTESIPILAESVGGPFSRKIFVFPEDFSVKMKKIEAEKSVEAIRQERVAAMKASRDRRKKDNSTDDVILF